LCSLCPAYRCSLPHPSTHYFSALYLAKQQHNYTLPLEFKTYRITDMQKNRAKKKTSIAWSKDEVKLLKKLYPDGGAGEIAERIGRPLTAVRQKAYHMGIKMRENRLWSADEIRQLKRRYPSEIAQSIADKLGRSYGAVVGKAYKLGLTEELRVWSKRELNLLKKLYPSRTAQEIARRLPWNITPKSPKRTFRKRLRCPCLTTPRTGCKKRRIMRRSIPTQATARSRKPRKAKSEKVHSCHQNPRYAA
jgi:hypothetical protein